MTETPQEYNDEILGFAELYGLSAREVAYALELTNPLPIIGCILEEANDRQETALESTIQNLADGVAWNYLNYGKNAGSEFGQTDGERHLEILNDFLELESLSAKERKDINSIDKLTNSKLMIDVGVGNIQMYTAIRLLSV